jgi:vacuolar-type H+-ATPase subunit I/STV1
MNQEQLKGFVRLEKRKRELDAELKQVKQQIDDLEQALIPQFIELGGEPSVRVDGLTIWLVQEIYASPINDREEVAHALKLSELGQYVAENYNTNSLTSYVRELWRELRDTARRENRIATEADLRAALPSALRPVLKISLLHKLSSTRSSKTTK